ncbi:MAG: phage portal protein, partial [Eubacteriales bacterium]|nr:phage portal protein [Eubacteriales bacterium]
MIRISENFIKDGIPNELILNCLKIHKKDLRKLKRNKKYYLGEHEILKTIKRKDDPNNKIVNNYASYITDTVCGYFMGSPISISSEKNIDNLLDTLNKLDINTHNSELARDLSIYGIAYELLYINEEGNLKIAVLPPEDTFVVYNDKIGDNSLFAI